MCVACGAAGGELVCPAGYDPTTMSSDFHLYCGRAVLRGVTSTVYFVGLGIGSCFGGLLADRFGRRPSSVLAMGFIALFFPLSAAAPTYEVYLAAKV